KKTSLPQLPNHFVGRAGLHQSGRFLPPSVQSYIIEARHLLIISYMRAACRAFRAWPDGQASSANIHRFFKAKAPNSNLQDPKTTHRLRALGVWVIGSSLEPIRLSLRAGFGFGIWSFLWNCQRLRVL